MSKPDFSAITELVPQASYDLIGRIIPGITVIVSLVVAILGPTQALSHLDRVIIHPDRPVSGWAVALALIVAYILAVVLDGIWHIPAHLRHLRDKDKPDLEASIGSLQLDAVELKSPRVSARHTKLGAEISQARVLIVGWLTSATINLYFLIVAFSSERLWLEVLLVISVVGALSFRKNVHRSRKYSLVNHWLLLGCDQLPASTEAAAPDEAQQEP